MKKYPDGCDVVLHHKDERGIERIIFPVTRYNDILNAPKLVDDVSTSIGAPFLLYQTDTVTISEDTIDKFLRK